MITRHDGIAIAIVHNKNPARNNYIFPHLDQLADALTHTCPVIRLEAWAQPDVRPHGTRMALIRDAIYAQLQREWARYCLHDVKSSWRAIRVFIKNSRQKYLPAGDQAKRWMRNGHIETIVTDKHIRLWQQFLDTDKLYLLVFEDDAVFKDNSVQGVLSLQARLVSQAPSRPVYIDLAGGCALPDLAIDTLLAEQDEHFRRYRKPVTNTACVYMLNRATVELFVTHLVRRPWLRLLSIDWLMNKLFMLSDLRDDQALCLHADPSIFQHGSTTGHYVTWQA